MTRQKLAVDGTSPNHDSKLPARFLSGAGLFLALSLGLLGQVALAKDIRVVYSSPEQFLDDSFLQKLERSGFAGGLYGR